MENVVIDIPVAPLTQSGEFSLEIKDKDRLLTLIALSAASILHKYRLDSLNVIETNAKGSLAYEEGAAINSSFISYGDKRSYYSDIANLYLYQGTDAFSSITFNAHLVDNGENLANSDAKHLDALVRAFGDEVKKYGHYILVDFSVASSLFKAIATNLAKIKFKDCTVELTPSNSFKIKLLLPDGKLLVITKPFSDIDDLDSNEVIFGIFQNKKCLISDAKNIVDLVNGINDYLDSK